MLNPSEVVRPWRCNDREMRVHVSEQEYGFPPAAFLDDIGDHFIRPPEGYGLTEITPIPMCPS